MKLLKHKLISLLAMGMAALPLLVSCETDEIQPAKAVLVSSSYLNFEARNPGEQTVTVYADGQWSVEAPEWLSVVPSEGDGTMDVLISPSENVDGGEIDKPREVDLVFKGEKLMSQALMNVKQVGDRFRGIEFSNVSAVESAPDQTLVKMNNVVVVAKSLKGIIVSDGKSFVHVANSEAQIGDKLEIWGTKLVKNGMTVIVETDRFQKLSSGNAVSLPSAKDITAGFDQYKSGKSEYVAVQGIFNGTKVSVIGSKHSLVILDPLPEFDLGELFAHKLTLKGFSAGQDANGVNLIVTSVEDNGEVPRLVWFEDDFSWLKRYEEAWNKANPSKLAGDSVGAKKSDQAPNLANPNDKVFAPMGFFGEFQERGYDDFVGQGSSGPHNSIYLQTYYLKFSRTNVHNGLKLTHPLPSDYAGQDITFQFDWCAHCDNNKPADDIQLIVEIVGEGTIASNGKKESDPIFHKQSKTEMEYFWQNVSMTLTGLNSESKIYIRPLNYLNAEGVMPHRQRWYIDNILLYSYDMD